MYSMGLDLGFGNTKIFDGKGATTQASHIAALGVRYDNDTERTGVSRIEFEGGRWVVGQYAAWVGSDIVGLGMNRLLGSMEVRAITYAALGNHFAQYGKPKAGINVCVGLPAELLISEFKQATVAAVTSWLTGRHTWVQDGKEVWVVVDSVSVRSQAAGALFDMILTKDGSQTRDATYASGDLGIISIGYNTVELSGILAGKTASPMMASETYGVRRLLESLNTRNNYRLSELDAMLRDNKLNGELPGAIDAWSDRVIGFIDSTWGKTSTRLKRVILVGGGAKYAEPSLNKMLGQRLFIPDNYIISIARGLYKRAVADEKG